MSLVRDSRLTHQHKNIKTEKHIKKGTPGFMLALFHRTLKWTLPDKTVVEKNMFLLFVLV